MEPITYISINLGPDVGANDSVIGVRVVPDGRNGPEVYGRTLSADEPDTGVGITVETGDKLVFPAGSVKFTLRDVDKHALPGSDGYSPVANTVWTWLQIPPPPTEDFFHYMLAAARRLDAAHALYVSTLRQLTSDPGEPFMRTRVRTFYALSSAEAMCITLNRALTMISIAQAKLSVNTPVPGTVQAVQESVQAIRNAF